MSKFCGFCKKNGEIDSFWRSHSLRDENHEVTCPVLKKYTCPGCGETGKHTASYCPKASPASIKPKPELVNKKLTSVSATKRPALKPISEARAPRMARLIDQQQLAKQQLLQVPSRQQLKQQQKPVKLKQDNLIERQQEQVPKLDLNSIPPYFASGKDIGLMPILQTLISAQMIEPRERIYYLLDHGYNPLRFEFIRQAAYIADYTIIQLGV